MDHALRQSLQTRAALPCVAGVLTESPPRNRKHPVGSVMGRWGWGTPLKRRPPPGVTGVPKLVLVVKPLARLGLVTVPVAARHAINSEVGHGDGSFARA